MYKQLCTKYSNQFLSKWIILFIDVVLTAIAFHFAVFVRGNFDASAFVLNWNMEHLAATLLVYTALFLIVGSYRGIIRRTGLVDAYMIVKVSTFSFGILLILSFLKSEYPLIRLFDVPRSVLLIHFLLTMMTLLGFRFFVKSVFQTVNKKNANQRRTRVLIFGSGAAGEITHQSLRNEINIQYDLVGYIDDNTSKQGKIQDGVPVYSREKALNHDFVTNKRVHQLIIAVQDLPTNVRRGLIESGMDLNLKVKVVPPTSEWIHGQLTTKQIKDVRIEDLLERESIKLDSTNVSREIQDKVVMVTGAAGSIGSEILRQVLHFSPKHVIGIDQAESAIYDLEMDLLHNRPNHHQNTTFVVADVTHPKRMDTLFAVHKPDVIFHAAAYKHVPLMEAHPYEAISVNVFGTKLLADLAIQYNVKKMVVVSTDKAVNPTNVMGASKRIAEMYVQAKANQKGKTQFVTTRFGNVLGSNGSVIPLFRNQIEHGGPITITHPEITRFFMTIPEACNLVLEAGAMGQGGEIYVFDMGDSIKIVDLAKNMIRLSGLTLNKDIEIKFTGLRPGEKLYEELLANSENTCSTHHEKIMIAKSSEMDYEQFSHLLEALKNALKAQKPDEMVHIMKQIAKEYKSNNSEFSRLDV
jgi:FlaA1/EpsC-like NDP-sugar epimerase